MALVKESFFLLRCGFQCFLSDLIGKNQNQEALDKNQGGFSTKLHLTEGFLHCCVVLNREAKSNYEMCSLQEKLSWKFL